ncbi:MAG: EamA family transporter [Firmicutes bacterium]|nr:EamA family transporter [Bacillota bacterium]
MENLFSDNKNISRSVAIALLVLVALLWSSGGLLIKLISWNPIAIAGFRSAVAALFILLIIKKPRITWSFPQVGGAIAYALTVISFVTATKLTTAANAILLQYSAPIYVAVFGAWFLKEKAKLLDWIIIFFVISGMFLFFLDELSMDNLYGNLLAVFSGLCFAALAIFMRKQKYGSPLESAFLGNIVTAIIGLPFMFNTEKPDLTGWCMLLVLGIFQLGLSYILYSVAIKHVTALEATLITVLEPILNPLWVYLFTGEAPGKWAMVGGFIVLISVTVRCIISAVRPDITTISEEKPSEESSIGEIVSERY